MSITRAQIATQLLNEMAPKGEKLAYINNREAELLKRMGGAGVDINKTGIKSYFDPGSGRGSVSESLSQAAFGSSGPTFSSDGGNGSFTGAHLFTKEFGLPVIGIPGTIDNDLYGTDFTLGYDSATNVVTECVDKIRDTASSHNRLFFVEVMGRDTGFIALRTAVATGALDVILPEANRTMEELLSEIARGFANRKTSNIVLVAEGNRLGNTFEIAERVKDHYPFIDAKVTILGHLQRGGSPSCFDRVLASKLGVAAVEALFDGKTDVMCGVVNNEVTFTFLQKAIQNQVPLNMDLLRISKILSI